MLVRVAFSSSMMNFSPLSGVILGQFVDVVDLVDGDALVRVVQALVVHVGVEVTLGSQHFLDPVVAPARPMVRGEHDLRIETELEEGFGDVFRPAQRMRTGLRRV